MTSQVQQTHGHRQISTRGRWQQYDLRHTHKTWLIEDDIPEIAQAQRLGHRLPGVRGIFHVTPAMRQRITDALQARWLSTQPAPAATVRRLRAE